MASTRNNNTTSEYKLQQHQFQRIREYMITPNSDVIINSVHPEFGVNIQKLPNDQLQANNSTDIESVLFGIGSTNHVKPNNKVKPEFKRKSDVKFHDRIELINSKLEHLKYQRPLIN